jgi:hypothetical protein
MFGGWSKPGIVYVGTLDYYYNCSALSPESNHKTCDIFFKWDFKNETFAYLYSLRTFSVDRNN